MTKKSSGFTLVELMVVISIIAILAAAGAVVFTNVQKGSRDAKRESDLKLIQSALEQYHADNGHYPITSDVTNGGSISNPNMYLRTIPADPQGNAYIYTALPAACDNSATPCTTYCLSINLEMVPSSPYNECGNNAPGVLPPGSGTPTYSYNVSSP